MSNGKRVAPASLPVDQTPPQLVLYGSPNIVLSIHSSILDMPGYSATDAGSPDNVTVVVTGIAALSVALAGEGIDFASMDTASSVGPYVMSYRAIDEAGNSTPLLFRLVMIDLSCPKAQFRCPDSFCSDSALCVRLPKQPSTKPLAYVPPLDMQPPQLVVTMDDGDSLLMAADADMESSTVLSTSVAGMLYSDAGSSPSPSAPQYRRV
jgi:hypothetical protein